MNKFFYTVFLFHFCDDCFDVIPSPPSGIVIIISSITSSSSSSIIITNNIVD